MALRSGSFPGIEMMQSADLGNFDQPAKRGRLDRPVGRRIFVEREVSSKIVVQVGNLIPIVLNRESFSIRGIRGVDVLSGFTERF